MYNNDIYKVFKIFAARKKKIALLVNGNMKKVIIMDVYKELLSQKTDLAIVGLGYVGMPLAVAFAQKIKVTGFDLNTDKIALYKKGLDPTKEVGDEAVANCTVDFTSDEKKLKKASFYIVAVPTPVNHDHTPDLTPVEGASKIVGRNLHKGAIVVYESTVYPGVTEDICVPIMEKESGLKCGKDFFVGYSPERINPGDKTHRLQNIVKIVSGMNAATLNTVAKVYELVVEVGVYRAENIKVAEAAKVIENAQRDVNIAFMNELSQIFNRMGIDTKSVLAAAGTKWNFLHFTPGLVGGHCIGVDPYYLTYKAEEKGYHSEIIAAGRRINSDMGKYVVENLVKNMIKANIPVEKARIGILGFTFKDNSPDVRNTRVVDIVQELGEYNIQPMICDQMADKSEAKRQYGLTFVDIKKFQNLDALIIAVAHDEFRSLTRKQIGAMFKKRHKKVVLDIKGILDRNAYLKAGYVYWRL